MNLVDEEDNLALRLYYAVDYALQSLLKLTLILGTSHEGTHVEGIDFLFLQVLRHITAHYTLCQSLSNSRLTCTRFAYQYRVVLGSA